MSKHPLSNGEHVIVFDTYSKPYHCIYTKNDGFMYSVLYSFRCKIDTYHHFSKTELTDDGLIEKLKERVTPKIPIIIKAEDLLILFNRGSRGKL